jgi:phosphate:Na+ symporter
MSPAHPELAGVDRLAAETPRQIANAHTIFNVANTILFIGFTTQLARIVEKMIPDRDLEDEVLAVSAKYLDQELLSTPSLAIDRVRLEVLHMGETVQDMLRQIMPAILSGNRTTLKTIQDMDDQVDLLYAQIIAYMGQISKRKLTEKQTSEFLGLMEAISSLENIGDTIETNFVFLGNERIDAGVSISKPTRKVLTDFHLVIERALASAIQAVSQSNREVAKLVIDMKDEISNLADSAAAHQAERLVAEEPNRIPAYTIEIDIIEKQKRIYYFAKRMAKTVLSHEDPEMAA